METGSLVIDEPEDISTAGILTIVFKLRLLSFSAQSERDFLY